MSFQTLAEVASGPTLGRTGIVLGVFDGVHRGHRTLLSAVREAAAARGARPVALVFHPPPIEIIRPGTTVPRLSPSDETLDRVEAAGVRAVGLRFDAALRELAPDAFLDGLRPALDLAVVVMTPDSAFGRDRAGTPQRLSEIGGERGFEVVLVEPETDEGPISSSRIRQALAEGDLETATRLLGRWPAVSGTVVRGDGRGQSLGYPTANLRLAYPPALPPLGIYAGLADDRRALISIGRRPTFHQDGEVVVEANLLDWEGDLYDHQLRVELVARLRDERRFASAQQLVAQMQRDEDEARKLLSAEM